MTDDTNTSNWHHYVVDKSHRAQLLQHCSVTNLPNCLYVIADTSSVLQVVHIKFKREDLEDYKNTMQIATKKYFGWIYDREELPQAVKDFGILKSKHCLIYNLFFWKALHKCCEDYKRKYCSVIPSARLIIPTSNAFHNTGKTGVDTLSLYLAPLNMFHCAISVTGAMVLRLVQYMIYNVFVLWRILGVSFKK